MSSEQRIVPEIAARRHHQRLWNQHSGHGQTGQKMDRTNLRAATGASFGAIAGSQRARPGVHAAVPDGVVFLMTIGIGDCHHQVQDCGARDCPLGGRGAVLDPRNDRFTRTVKVALMVFHGHGGPGRQQQKEKCCRTRPQPPPPLGPNT